MAYFLLGLALFVILLLAARGFANASPAALARGIRISGAVLALLAAVALAVRGAFLYAIPLATLALWLWGQASLPATGSSRGAASSARRSRVGTATLEMELDLDTGDLYGTVRSGRFAGRDLSEMSPAEIAELWADCRYSDPQSSQILEAYLDRVAPDWRSRQRGKSDKQANTELSLAEAYRILELRPGATRSQIISAHREMMLRHHPDRGGSDAEAARINAAKDVLLAALKR